MSTRKPDIPFSVPDVVSKLTPRLRCGLFALEELGGERSTAEVGTYYHASLNACRWPWWSSLPEDHCCCFTSSDGYKIMRHLEKLELVERSGRKWKLKYR